MANDEITALRRLMESINRQAAANSQALGKLTSDVNALRQELTAARQHAERAIQMCNDFATRYPAALERSNLPPAGKD